MGRRSRLTDQQWEEIAARLLMGEPVRKLGQEYGIAHSAISERFSKRTQTIKAVANQIVTADKNLRSMPMQDQLTTLRLADELKAISYHLAAAAKYGSATSHRLLSIANQRLEFVDDMDPFSDDSAKALRDVAGLTKVANESANLGIGLLQANKEMVKSLNDQDSLPPLENITISIEDAS